MRQQTVRNRPIQGVKGFLAILGAAFALALLSLATQNIAQRTGMGGVSLIAWALAVVVAVYVMFEYIGEYRYTLSDGVVVFERTFGTHARVLLALRLGEIEGIGPVEITPEPGQAQPRLERFTIRRNSLPHQLLTCRKDGRRLLVEVQMEPEFEAALREALSAAAAEAAEEEA